MVERLDVKGSQLSLNIYLAFQELPLSGPALLGEYDDTLERIFPHSMAI